MGFYSGPKLLIRRLGRLRVRRAAAPQDTLGLEILDLVCWALEVWTVDFEILGSGGDEAGRPIGRKVWWEAWDRWWQWCNESEWLGASEGNEKTSARSSVGKAQQGRFEKVVVECST